MSKVAVITGGCSGMGLETAQHLAQDGNWKLHLLDLNPKAGETARQAIPQAQVHQVNVTSYDSLAKTFQTIFDTEGRLDFVFANAGIVERHSFYDKPETQESQPPPQPNLLTLDINLNAVVTTTYLALHYFRLSPHKGHGSCIVMTGSSGSLYPSEYTPVYSASKAAVLMFMRSIAYNFHQEGIRVHTICPGTVRTNLILPEEWDVFPQEYFTPLSKVASIVEMLVKGGQLHDSKGRTVSAGEDYGLAVEICGKNHYFRDQVPFGDENMKNVMLATSMKAQQVNFDAVKKKEAAAGKSGPRL